MIEDAAQYEYLACLALGFVLGLCGGLRIGFALLDSLGRRIEQLERRAPCAEALADLATLPQDR